MNHGNHKPNGDTHPRHLYEHEHDEVVLGMDCAGWIKEWYKWAFVTGENQFKLPNLDDMSFLPETKGQKIEVKGDEGVWFLGYPMYNYNPGGTVIRYANLPCGKLHFLAPVYNCHPSTELYPSITKKEDLFNIAKEDVDKVYYLEVNLDGINLAGCRVPMRDSFDIDLVDNNVFGIGLKGISPSREGRSRKKMSILSDGYWIFLNVLPPGDHILRLKGYSPLYKLDVEFHLGVRGPCK